MPLSMPGEQRGVGRRGWARRVWADRRVARRRSKAPEGDAERPGEEHGDHGPRTRVNGLFVVAAVVFFGVCFVTYVGWTKTPLDALALLYGDFIEAIGVIVYLGPNAATWLSTACVRSLQNGSAGRQGFALALKQRRQGERMRIFGAGVDPPLERPALVSQTGEPSTVGCREIGNGSLLNEANFEGLRQLRPCQLNRDEGAERRAVENGSKRK